LIAVAGTLREPTVKKLNELTRRGKITTKYSESDIADNIGNKYILYDIPVDDTDLDVKYTTPFTNTLVKDRTEEFTLESYIDCLTKMA